MAEFLTKSRARNILHGGLGLLRRTVLGSGQRADRGQRGVHRAGLRDRDSGDLIFPPPLRTVMDQADPGPAPAGDRG